MERDLGRAGCWAAWRHQRALGHCPMRWLRRQHRSGAHCRGWHSCFMPAANAPMPAPPAPERLRSPAGRSEPHALPIEQSTPGFANSRVRALPHVHLRSLGSRPSSLRGLNEEFYKKKLKKQKSYGAWKIEKAILHIEYLVLFASVPTGFAWVCPPRFLTRIAHRRLGLRRSPMASDERGGLEPELSRKKRRWAVLWCGVP